MSTDPSDTGLLDTSVVVDLANIDPDLMPDFFAVSVITLAELSAGSHAASDAAERARRQNILQRVETELSPPVPLDRHVAGAYGMLYARAVGRGAKRRAAGRSTF